MKGLALLTKTLILFIDITYSKTLSDLNYLPLKSFVIIQARYDIYHSAHICNLPISNNSAVEFEFERLWLLYAGIAASSSAVDGVVRSSGVAGREGSVGVARTGLLRPWFFLGLMAILWRAALWLIWPPLSTPPPPTALPLLWPPPLTPTELCWLFEAPALSESCEDLCYGRVMLMNNDLC